MHTPATTFNRCPFLFTVICAVSSRFYTSSTPPPSSTSSHPSSTSPQPKRIKPDPTLPTDITNADTSTDKSKIYPIAMYFAKSAASKNLIEGLKSVELSQAYLLLSIYSMPARRWEEDRSWLYLGTFCSNLPCSFPPFPFFFSIVSYLRRFPRSRCPRSPFLLF